MSGPYARRRSYRGASSSVRMRANLREVVLNGNLKLLLKVEALGNDSFRASLEDNRTFTFPLYHKRHQDDTGAMYYVVAVVLLYGLSIIFMIGSVIKKSKQDHGLSKYMRDLDKVKRLERRQEKFKTRMAMQRKRGRYARTARPFNVQFHSRLFHHDTVRLASDSEKESSCSSLLPNLSDIYEDPKQKRLIQPIITVKEPPLGSPAPWSDVSGNFEFPPYSYVHGSYHRKKKGENRKISLKTVGTSPVFFETDDNTKGLDTLEEEECMHNIDENLVENLENEPNDEYDYMLDDIDTLCGNEEQTEIEEIDNEGNKYTYRIDYV